MSSEIAIQVENLSKCYQIYDHPRDRLKQFMLPRFQRMIGQQPKQYFHEFWALKDISFDVKKGETVGIIGKNGSGKSTLLQMICGTLNPTKGSIQTNGRIAALLELGSGFNPEFTGRENVYLNAALLGLSKEETDQCFDDIAAFADIGEFIEQPVKVFSSGMMVRLAFAVQAMVDPDILIVDEALAVGDEKFQRKCFARLETLKSKGTAILFVSHSAPSIIELCERTLLVDQGTRILYSKASEVVRAYQKIIYAPVEEYKMLLQEYREIDKLGLPLKTAELSAECDNDQTKKETDRFDSGLVPETTISYPIQGAEIESIVIKDEDGNVVNILQFGKDYIFEISGTFLNFFSSVYFGIHIRNISGAVVSGQRYPEEGVYVKDVNVESRFCVKFSFGMNLLPGVYFVGGGIWSDQEPGCLHRMLDVLMFRVITVEKRGTFGYVDLASDKPKLILE